MENSGHNLFEDNTPQWYVAVGERWVGPLSSSEVYEQIVAQKITWAHYVWKKGQPDWKRLCDVKSFQSVVPHQPAKSVQKEIKETAKPVVKQSAGRRETARAELPEMMEGRVWYLHYNDAQFGPYSQEEISRYLQVGKIHSRIHAWREGMANWQRLEQISVFSQSISKSPPKSAPQAVEQRSDPRRPLVAKILLSNDQSVIVGVCRDISIGGMQVLTERLPGKAGSRLKMNISPSSPVSQASSHQIEAFVAEGVIVRILEDGRGFSFRFQNLNEKSKQAIEAYIDLPN